MNNDILLFPFLNDELKKKIRFQKSRFTFYYHDRNHEEHKLQDEPIEAFSSIFCIKDENGIWTQDDYDLCLKRHYCLRTFQCLFGENGLSCKSAKLGLAMIWTSADSKQRGVIPIGTFSYTDQIMDAVAVKEFDTAQLRGEVNFSTVLYIAESGMPEKNELHLANTNGYVLGELDNYTIKLDGTGSTFPIFEVSEPGQPLWYVRCDWTDPTADSFADCISINLNTAHRNYKYIDRKQKNYDPQLLAEIMAGAISVIVEEVRRSVYWDAVIGNENLEQGSVGQAVYYFMETLEWDLSTPTSVSLCARKFFDQRMQN